MRPERRFHRTADLRIERRASDAGQQRDVLIGHAIRFDEWTTLYRGRYIEVREVVRRGATLSALRERQDVRALFNHDRNIVLGRTISETLRLREDDVGLLMEDDPPDTDLIRDMVIAPINRGDVSGMSFAFLPRPKGERVTELEDENGRTIIEVELTDIDLFDVSVVTYPAYNGTDVEVSRRSLWDEWVAKDELIGDKRRMKRIEILDAMKAQLDVFAKKG